jgi:hypothetical protein
MKLSTVVAGIFMAGMTNGGVVASRVSDVTVSGAFVSVKRSVGWGNGFVIQPSCRI